MIFIVNSRQNAQMLLAVKYSLLNVKTDDRVPVAERAKKYKG